MELDPHLSAFMEAAPLGVLLVDDGGTIRAANACAAEIFGYPTGDLCGRAVESLIPERLRSRHQEERHGFTADPHARRMGTGRDLTGLRRDGGEFPIEVGLGFTRMSGAPVTICFVADISYRHRIQRENLRLIVELQGALDELKRLSGLLAVCASCKRIRDKSGAWAEMEQYIQEHSEAQFSHGLCPDCARRLYPQYFRPEAP